MRGEAVEDAAIFAEIEPAFMERDGRRTDMVVLACTHYPFLVERFRALAPWPVEWIDPAPAIARRVATVAGAAAPGAAPAGAAYLTSGRSWPMALAPLLTGLGMPPGERPLELPVPKRA
jgi:glutamate racemase